MIAGWGERGRGGTLIIVRAWACCVSWGIGVVRGGVFGLSGRRLGTVTHSFGRGMRGKLGARGTRVRYVPAFVAPGTSGVGNGSLILSLKKAGCQMTLISFDGSMPSVRPGGN